MFSMKVHAFGLILLSACFFAASGCEKTSSDASSEAQRKADANSHPTAHIDEKDVQANERTQISGQVSASDLSSEEKAHLEKINSRYLGIVARPGGITGMPTAKEWLGAAALNDAEIEQRAKSGRPEDYLIYADRALERIEDELAQAAAEGRPVDDEVLTRWKIVADVQSRMALRQGKSLFSVYARGKADSIVTGSPAPIAASMMVADSLGDPYAKQMLHDFQRNHREINVSVVNVLYQGMMRTLNLSKMTLK